MLKLKDEIHGKKVQMYALEQRILGSIDDASPSTSNSTEMSQVMDMLSAMN